MDHSQHDMAGMDHSAHRGHEAPLREVPQLSVDELSAAKPTAFSPQTKLHELKFVLGGDMERYVWHINGKAIHQDTNVDVREGELVRLTFQNETMMHHPMHLHGHFFRVLNQFGDRSPLKHTVDVPPHGTRVIEFYTNEPGRWMLHCHNLYHMHSGMGRVLNYLSFTPDPSLAHHGADPHHHDPVYFDGSLEASTNHGKAYGRLSKFWDTLELRAETREEHNRHWDVEGDLFYRRWLGAYFNLVGGGTVFRERLRGTLGAAVTLPMLVELQGLVDHKGELRADLHRRFQWAKHVFTDAEFTFRQHEKTELEVSLMYGPSWHWAAGLMMTEDRFGAGVQVRF